MNLKTDRTNGFYGELFDPEGRPRQRAELLARRRFCTPAMLVTSTDFEDHGGVNLAQYQAAHRVCRR